MKNRLGFTLVEILLVSAMFAVITVAVFNAFANGFKIWDHSQHVMVAEDIAIFLDRIAEDVRQTVIITGIPFKGNSTELSFPAIISGPTDIHGSRASEEQGIQIGAVRYVYDPDEKQIQRYQANYGQALKTEWSDPVVVASQIEDVSMRYYIKQDRGVDVKTQTDQADPGVPLPMGIMIDVQFSSDGQTYHMRRFLIVPVGGGI